MIKISASTLPAMGKLEQYIKRLDKTKVDTIHCDVMDGKFVDNKVFTTKDFDKVKKNTKKKTDVHLMVSDVDEYIEDFIKMKPNYITLHYESFDNEAEMVKAISLIKLYGIKVGISIKPKTPLSKLDKVLGFLDLLLVMSVEPGKGGQKFMSSAVSKVEEAKKLKRKKRNRFLIQVDGGINKKNIPKLKKAGADLLVIGSALYKTKNLKRKIKEFKKNK